MRLQTLATQALKRLETDSPEALSQQLRQGSSGALQRRRGVIALSLAASAALGLLTLYQMGLIRHMPEPPLPGFDADKVNGSAEAYSKLAIPDALLGVSSYAGTMLLAAMGGLNRAREHPWMPLALAAKVGLDATLASILLLTQVLKLRAFSFWSLLTSAATFATVPLVIPEARAALRHLLDQWG